MMKKLMVSSSPGREKLPAPPRLARLLYGKAVESRSRCRAASGSSAARSSPMFVSRSKSRGRSASAAVAAAAVNSEGGEPSSPKVTCIGQVRIRKKRLTEPTRSQPKKARSKSPMMMPCRCFHKSFLCSMFPVRKRSPGGGGDGGRRQSLWRKWACIRSGWSARFRQRKPYPVRPPPPPELVTFSIEAFDREEDGGVEDEKEEEATKALESSGTASPPKNALLLMRCRSAPHNRASSLATARFAVSPQPSPEPPSAPPLEEDEQRDERKMTNFANAGAALVQEADAESEQGDEARGSESQRPLVLPRSKSEPARWAATRLGDPEVASCFWPSQSIVGRRRRWSPAEEKPAPPLLTAT
ncbi:hypothetical protein Cni_G13352 [Canna indica]|uniref:Uncharacterized protein n=1 Tax=Canna indica TaxID=4628 RepID=A0AAQ3K9Y2_9LILI|nr:hypothetical protein Cni_G13352 [Canna indica]